MSQLPWSIFPDGRIDGSIFYTTHTSPPRVDAVDFGDRQIIAGPTRTLQQIDGRVTSMPLPKGWFDLAECLTTLPEAQRPDLVVAYVESQMECAPDLKAVQARKLLLMADTHHSAEGVARMVAYAKSQTVDGVAVVHDPHHLHWYAEAGVDRLAFIANPNVADFGLEPVLERRGICHVGTLYPPFYVRRCSVVAHVIASGLPLTCASLPAGDAAKVYSQCRLTLNCSLNGDLNMRFFEVLAAGGCLVTDRLKPQLGVDRWFVEGEDYLAYDTPDELVECLTRFLDRPDDCLRIARSGQRKYRQHHAPARRRHELMELIATGRGTDTDYDRRTAPIVGFGQNLPERMHAYGTVQLEVRLAGKSLLIACDPAIGARTISDMVDLPQTRVHVLPGPGDTPALAKDLEALGVGRQVLHGPLGNPADILVLHRSSDMVRIAGEHPRARLIIVHGAKGDPLKVKAKRLAALGYADIGAQMPIFYRDLFT